MIEARSEEINDPTNRPRRIVRKPVRFPDRECFQMDGDILHHDDGDSRNIAYTDVLCKGLDDPRYMELFSPKGQIVIRLYRLHIKQYLYSWFCHKRIGAYLRKASASVLHITTGHKNCEAA